LIKKLNLLPYLVISTLSFAGFVYVGTLLPGTLPADITNILKDSLQPLESTTPVLLVFFIFLNNAIKCFCAVVFGIFLGLPPLLFVCLNAMVIGAIGSVLSSSTGLNVIIAGLAPHGIIEIGVLILASSMGLSIGAETLKFFARQGSSARNSMRYSIRIFIRWMLPALLLGAIVEVLVTPLVVNWAGGTVVGILAP
jgi:stage II sporulation protein M